MSHDKQFLHSNSTYFAKAVLLTLQSKLCPTQNAVYCPSKKAS